MHGFSSCQTVDVSCLLRTPYHFHDFSSLIGVYTRCLSIGGKLPVAIRLISISIPVRLSSLPNPLRTQALMYSFILKRLTMRYNLSNLLWIHEWKNCGYVSSAVNPWIGLTYIGKFKLHLHRKFTVIIDHIRQSAILNQSLNNQTRLLSIEITT